MNEIRITIEFTTGTTVVDEADAKRTTLELLIEHLKEAHIIANDGQVGSGLFEARILKTEAEKL